MDMLLAAWPGINDALFHLFLFGFAAGTACYAAILLRGDGLERATGVIFAVWTLSSGVWPVTAIRPIADMNDRPLQLPNAEEKGTYCGH